MEDKHYTISIFEKPPKGGFKRYEAVYASCKKDLKEKVKTWNKEHKDEYMKLDTAFTL